MRCLSLFQLVTLLLGVFLCSVRRWPFLRSLVGLFLRYLYMFIYAQYLIWSDGSHVSSRVHAELAF